MGLRCMPESTRHNEPIWTSLMVWCVLPPRKWKTTVIKEKKTLTSSSEKEALASIYKNYKNKK